MPSRERRLRALGLVDLSPRIPPQWPEWSCRRKLLLTAQEGWCACCDELPVRYRHGLKRFTCGKAACQRQWMLLCQRDAQKKLYEERKAVAPFKAQMGRRPNR